MSEVIFTKHALKKAKEQFGVSNPEHDLLTAYLNARPTRLSVNRWINKAKRYQDPDIKYFKSKHYLFVVKDFTDKEIVITLWRYK